MIVRFVGGPLGGLVLQHTGPRWPGGWMWLKGALRAAASAVPVSVCGDSPGIKVR